MILLIPETHKFLSQLSAVPLQLLLLYITYKVVMWLPRNLAKSVTVSGENK